LHQPGFDKLNLTVFILLPAVEIIEKKLENESSFGDERFCAFFYTIQNFNPAKVPLQGAEVPYYFCIVTGVPTGI
jgi:hypothetical protein